MKGKLERDSLGYYLCDKCGRRLYWCRMGSSKLAREFIGVPFSERKLFYLCFKCASKFSALASREFLK